MTDSRPPTPAPPTSTRKLRDLTGPGITTAFGMEGTDLGITARTPSGRLLAVFGDTFAGAGMGAPHVGRPHPGIAECSPTTDERPGPGNPDWRSPVGLFADDAAPGGGLVWTGAAGPGPPDYAGQLIDYVHGRGCSTVLPGDVLTLGDTMYLHVMVNEGLGTVTRTEIHRSVDDGSTWEPTGVTFSPRLEGGHRQLWTWETGGDGFVYVMSTGFQRDKGVILMRVREEHLADPGVNGWQTWGYREGAWDWGNPTTIVLPGRIGEMYLRRCEDFWTLTYFDAEHYRIDCLTFPHIGADLLDRSVTTHTTLLHGCAWGDESDGSDPAAGPARVAQLYCGCPVPGSTPEEWHVVVSQWNTHDSAAGPAGWPYRSMQFVGSIPRPPGTRAGDRPAAGA
ncbi:MULTISPECIES: DUF4185 domain-containing protein [Dietzia]|uniref:DUF4185 domain-containing protein n=1 Tax=Dietzia TaxID=37914 RepID=UPI0015FA4A30|nr:MULTISPECIES: DUF4185 domain-containing protein [Dietzia]MBB1034403.1 DUF4185 domain-containing protein [Dietzia sp. CQ4]MBB1056807.1 DUF4185 domain-containing protein [Dietzia sp. B19]MCT1515020.1 DUF4185 domain-containing protein [Dietzia cercidiphylli]